MKVGGRIKTVRGSRGLTVAALAEKTGMSKAMISRVENDQVSPSLDALDKIAGALDVPAAYLLLKADEQVYVVRKGERQTYTFGANQLKVEVLSGRPNRALRAILVEVPPGGSVGCAEEHAHDGEEFHLVVEGTVQAIQGDERITLEAGDSFHWQASIPHKVINVGQGPARVLAVTSASMMQVLGEESDLHT